MTLFSMCETSIRVHVVATNRPHLTIIRLLDVQRYLTHVFGNIEILGNAADETVSVNQIITCHFKFGNWLSCISQGSTAGRVWAAKLPADERQRSSRGTTVGVDHILAASQWYVVWIWIPWTYNALWGTLVSFGHVSHNAITATFVD